MPRAYSMREAEGVGRVAVRQVTDWLWLHPETLRVRSVEHLAEFQTRDIDLLWKTRAGEVPIEVKGDRHDGTGNYFFETVSNAGTGTPGCFLYTEARYIYYCFVRTRCLHILPMPATREWFLAHQDQFTERRTRTTVGSGTYITVGRLVPVERVQQEVTGAQIVTLPPAGSWSWMGPRRLWRRLRSLLS